MTLIERTVISISEVRMSPDLKIATAFVAPLGAAPDDGGGRRGAEPSRPFTAGACRER